MEEEEKEDNLKNKEITKKKKAQLEKFLNRFCRYVKDVSARNEKYNEEYENISSKREVTQNAITEEGRIIVLSASCDRKLRQNRREKMAKKGRARMGNGKFD